VSSIEGYAERCELTLIKINMLPPFQQMIKEGLRGIDFKAFIPVKKEINLRLIA
jgi:hypothetical protein